MSRCVCHSCQWLLAVHLYSNRNCVRNTQMRLHVWSPFCHWRPAWCAEQTLQPLLLGSLQQLSNMSEVLESVLGWLCCSSRPCLLLGKLFLLTTHQSIFVAAIVLCCCPSTRSAQSMRRRASKDQSASLFLMSYPAPAPGSGLDGSAQN